LELEAGIKRQPLGRNGKPKRAATDEELAWFAEFWKIYPKRRRVARVYALECFVKRDFFNNGDLEAVEMLIKSVQVHNQSADWQKDASQWVPHPSTYLNREMDRDEIEEEVQCPRCNHSTLLHRTIEKHKAQVTVCESRSCDCAETVRYA